MNDRLEEIKEELSKSSPLTPHGEDVEWLITEVERLDDVHEHYLFELDRANTLTTERDERIDKWAEIVGKLEAENMELKQAALEKKK